MPIGVLLLRYSHPGIGHVSYLLVDQESRTAAVVDPAPDVDRYLEDAWRLGASVRHVFLTELRDDVSPVVGELRARACAVAYVGAWARPTFEFLPLKDGDALEFGRVRIRIAEVPGHRLESILLLIEERNGNPPGPLAALTGATVIPGDVGRPAPDPRDGFGTAEMAAQLYRSLREKVLSLPDATRLFPSRESDLDLFGEEARTVGSQRFLSGAFQPMSPEEFVRRVTMGMVGEAGGPEGSDLRMRPASLSELLRARRGGAQVVDVRDPIDFAAAHLEGSVNVPWASRFDGWVGAVLDRNRPVVLVAPPGREGAAAARLVKAGVEHVASYFRDETSALAERPGLLRRRRRISYVTLGARMLGERPTLLLDVRPDRLPRAGPPVIGIPLPLERLNRELAELPRGPEVIVCDDTPYRSSAAASLLEVHGFENVREVAGGLALWGRCPE